MIDKGKIFLLTAILPDSNNFTFYLEQLDLKTPPKKSCLAGM